MSDSSNISEVVPLADLTPEQDWFWTPEWQAKEREAEEDLSEGRFRVFDDWESFIRFLNG